MDNLRTILTLEAAEALGLNIEELRDAARAHGYEIRIEKTGNLRREVLDIRDFEALRGKIIAQRRGRQPASREPVPPARQITISNAFSRYSGASNLIEE